MRPLLLAILSLVLLYGCQSSRQVYVSPDFSLQIQHTLCNGPCPAYTLTVDTYGKVRYHGQAYTEQQGLWEKELDAQTMNKLTRTLRKSAFFSYDTVYNDPHLPALPWTVVQYSDEGQAMHQVRFRANGPETFRTLIHKLEAIIGPDGYQPVYQPQP